MFDELERLHHPTTPENEANFVATATIWPCQICRRPRFDAYELADKAARILPAEPCTCSTCGDGSCP